MRRCVLVGLSILMLALIGGGEATAQEQGRGLQIVGDETISLDGTASVVVYNPAASEVEVSAVAVPFGTARIAVTPAMLPAGYTTVLIEAEAVGAGSDGGRPTHLVLEAKGFPPAIAPVDISNPVDWWPPWLIPVVAVAFALVLTTGAAISGGVIAATNGRVVWASNRMGPATWSFKSWASSLTAVISALTAIGASNLVADSRQVFAKETYVALSLLAGLLVAAAPVVYGALGRKARESDTYKPQDINYSTIELLVEKQPWSLVTPAELAAAGPNDMKYALDKSSGQITFGDGVYGKRPDDLAELIFCFGDGETKKIRRGYAPIPTLLNDGAWTIDGYLPSVPTETPRYQGFVWSFVLSSILTVCAVVVQLLVSATLTFELTKAANENGLRWILWGTISALGLGLLGHAFRSVQDTVSTIGSIPGVHRPSNSTVEAHAALTDLVERVPSLKIKAMLEERGPHLLHKWAVWLTTRSWVSFSSLQSFAMTTALRGYRAAVGVKPGEAHSVPGGAVGSVPLL